MKDSSRSNSPGPVTKEIRFAVVMYGGVSLAIYMNGIAQELLSLVRSTARQGWDSEGTQDGVPDEQKFRFQDPRDDAEPAKADSANFYKTKYLSGTELVYRDLAKKLTDDGDDNRVRFIIDIISGTSAGGINGIFLAKALANGQLIDQLKNLWVEQGDIEKLLYDKKSLLPGLNLPSKIPSLLNGERMYLELLSAFDGMDSEKGSRALAEELDLYVTTTDIRGEVVPLRTADRLVYERRYKHDFHFQFARPGLETPAAFYPPISRAQDGGGPGVTQPSSGGADSIAEGGGPGRGQNDFTEADNPFLAFAARCTSSFPVAFEPMQLGKTKDLLESQRRGKLTRFNEAWKQRFFSASQRKEETDYSATPIEQRSFGDGGYLNNKPFSYTIDALSRRSSDIPSVRKLIFIDPAPEDLRTVTPEERKEPNALENALAALIKLPGYEPIRQDLLRINERSRFIRKVNEMTRMVSHAVLRRKVKEHPRSDVFGPVSDEPFENLLEVECPSYVSYLLLRVYDTTDKMAQIVAQAANIERESSYYFAILCLVRAWRELYYERDEATPVPQRDAGVAEPENAPQGRSFSAFLNDFDIWCKVRFARFLATQVDSLYTLDDNACEQLAMLGIVERGTDTNKPSTWFPEGQGKAFRDALCKAKSSIDKTFRIYRDAARNLSDSGLKERVGKFELSLLDYVLCVEDAAQQEPPTNQELRSEGPRTSNIPSVRPQAQDAERQYMDRARKAIQGKGEKPFPGILPALNDVATFFRTTANVKSRLEGGEPLAQLIADLGSFGKSEITEGGKRAYDALYLLSANFLDYDASLFPLTYGTDIGELDPIDIVRFSPEDATSIVDEIKSNRKKLRGISLGHFGAFLDATWRDQDILWGRLDAAERIICSVVVPPPENSKEPYDEETKELIERATDAIIDEYLDSRQIAVAAEELLKISAQQAEKT